MEQCTFPLIPLVLVHDFMYIICICFIAIKLPFFNTSIPRLNPTMLAGNRKSRRAKELRCQGHAGFAKRAKTAPSLDGSVYCPSDNGGDESSTDSDMGDIEDKQLEGSAAEPLQRLYVEFLPDHLQLDYAWNMHKKVLNRPAVYTRDSNTTSWRRKMMQKKVAEGYMTLDAFIQRKVCPREPNEVRDSASYYI